MQPSVYSFVLNYVSLTEVLQRLILKQCGRFRSFYSFFIAFVGKKGSAVSNLKVWLVSCRMPLPLQWRVGRDFTFHNWRQFTYDVYCVRGGWGTLKADDGTVTLHECDRKNFADVISECVNGLFHNLPPPCNYKHACQGEYTTSSPVHPSLFFHWLGAQTTPPSCECNNRSEGWMGRGGGRHKVLPRKFCGDLSRFMLVIKLPPSHLYVSKIQKPCQV